MFTGASLTSFSQKLPEIAMKALQLRQACMLCLIHERTCEDQHKIIKYQFIKTRGFIVNTSAAQ
jgi:hypothetical protein